MEVGRKKRVFVVHGRNKAIRKSIFQFLRAIKLDPIEWPEVVKSVNKPNPHIGEILDALFAQAQAVVVIMTPDDLAQLQPWLCGTSEPEYERKPTGQARPNVLFEAGMAMGRCPNRTVLVEIGKLRRFSDIDGHHVVRLDNTTAKRQEFAARLKSAGCNINLDGTDWHDEGDFSVVFDPKLPRVRSSRRSGTSKAKPVSTPRPSDTFRGKWQNRYKNKSGTKEGVEVFSVVDGNGYRTVSGAYFRITDLQIDRTTKTLRFRKHGIDAGKHEGINLLRILNNAHFAGTEEIREENTGQVKDEFDVTYKKIDSSALPEPDGNELIRGRWELTWGPYKGEAEIDSFGNLHYEGEQGPHDFKIRNLAYSHGLITFDMLNIGNNRPDPTQTLTIVNRNLLQGYIGGKHDDVRIYKRIH